MPVEDHGLCCLHNTTKCRRGSHGAYLHHGLRIQPEVEITEDKVGCLLEPLVDDPGRRGGKESLRCSPPATPDLSSAPQRPWSSTELVWEPRWPWGAKEACAGHLWLKAG